MVTYKVTNDKLFYNKIIDIDTDGLHTQQNQFYGDISIETENGLIVTTGYFGQDDYVEEYGFKLVKI